VIARALSRDRELRQRSASSFVRELEAAAKDMTVWPLPNSLRKRASKYPTLVGTGARPKNRTQLSVAKRTEPVVSRTKTLNALADRAQRFSSSNPPPADMAQRFSSSNPPAAEAQRFSSSNPPPAEAAERAQRFTSSTPAPPPLGGSEPALPAPARLPRIDTAAAAHYDNADSDTHVRLRPSPTPAAPVPTPVPTATPTSRPLGRTTRRGKGKNKSSPGTISSVPPANDTSVALRSPLPEAPPEPDAATTATPASVPPEAVSDSIPAAETSPASNALALVDPLSPQSKSTPSKPPSVDDALARLAALEAEDDAAFRPRKSKRGPVILIGLVAAAAIAIGVWGHRPAQLAPAVSAAVAPSPEPTVAPSQPAPPVAAAPVAPAAPAATEAPAAQAASPSAPEVKAPSTPEPSKPAAEPKEAEPKASSKSSSHSASSHSSKKADEKHHTPARAVEAAPAPEPKVVESADRTGDPGRAKMLGDQAGDLMIRGDFAAAARAYQQAIGADASYAPAWRGRGLALERLGKNHDAVAAFRQFLKLEPNGANAEKIRARLKALDDSP
jgi:hypothetical protein